MELIKGFEEIDRTFPGTIVTIGNFDGLHLGHRQIIESVVKRAKNEGGTSVVYTFKPHPHLALTPAENLQLLNTYEEKAQLISELNVDVLVEQPFSREFSTISAERFFTDVLLKRLSAKAIYVGYDFGFGKNRQGNLETLGKFCKQEGVELHVATPLKVNGEVCSSSRIRNYVQAGQIDKANALLGREFFYRGLVVRGNGRGKKLGFATANVHTESKLRVKEGVYATRVFYKGKLFESVTNVGRQPTFNKKDDVPVVVETHILGFDQDIYGEMIEVRIVQRIRDEVRFSGVEALVEQIQCDVQSAKKILDKH